MKNLNSRFLVFWILCRFDKIRNSKQCYWVLYAWGCAFASSALYRLATYDLRGSNCSSKAAGDLLKLKLFLECQRNNYVHVDHVLRVWFEGMPAAIGWPGGGTGCMTVM